MSLILDALKKLERERESPDHVVVVGSVPWQGVRRWRLAPMLAWVAALLVVGGVASWLVLARSSRAQPAAATTVPAPAGSAATAATPAAAAPPAPAQVAPSPSPSPSPSPPPPRPAAGAEVPSGGRPTVPSAPAPSKARAEPPAAAGADLQLMAISSQQGQPVAVISGRVVREGDLFDGVRVVRIGEAEVELEVRGRRRVLRF